MKYLYEPYTYPKRHPQWVDADTAIRHIQKGQRILIGSGCAEPQHLVHALVRNASCFRDNEVVHILTVGVAPYAEPQYQESFRHNAFFIGHNIRESVAQGHADYMPIFLSDVPRLLKTRQMPVHAVLLQVSPPNENGCVSLGVSVDILPAAIMSADLVIAQVNKNMPETCGVAQIPVEAIDYFVQADEPLVEFPQGDPDDISMQIGKNMARYIQDGDTLQLGIGNIPDSVLMNLKDKNDLGIHSEMVSDGLIELYKNGNITNKCKGIHEGQSIVGFVLGTRKLYDVIHKNPDFQFYPSEYTNDPFVICQNNNMVSINSAIQIDLTGQVCSDSIGTKFYSGFGGQVDFVRGSKRSKGGRSFLALPSTAKKGTVSRIVTSLSPGAGVVTTRADVQYVVTEYGVAYLHGKNIRERGLALTQIAHPKFRDELMSYLKDKHYVYLDQRTIKDDSSLVKAKIPHSKKFKDKTIYFRPLRPSDQKAIQDFFYSHRPETIYQRYLTNVEALPHTEAQARVSVDYNQDMAIAGFNDWTPYAQMICLGRYIRHKNHDAEIGFVVKENYQGLGLGSFMCEHLIEAAKNHKIIKLFAYVAYSNVTMIKIFKKNGFLVRDSKSVDGLYVELNLQKNNEASL